MVVCFRPKTKFLKKFVFNLLLGSALLNTAALYAQPLPPQFVREDINQFMNKPMRIAALKRGIQVMKQRPATDPTSWAFQANIHGSNDTSNALWNQCQHRHWWFLAWHRAYLYYLEKMLQEAAAESRLRIPYWNYTDPDSRSLPAPFLDTTSVLYVPGRQLSAPTDEVTPSSVNTALALSRSSFVGSDAQLGFGGGQEAAPIQFPYENKAGSLEKLPHNAIHVQVGGLMQNPRTAAADPIFWLHHSNIDRLWELWLKGTGHANPTDTAFLNATFTLYNEKGVPVTHQVKDFLGDVQKFGYYYDDQPPVTPTASQPQNKPALTAKKNEQSSLVALIAAAKSNSGDKLDVTVPPITVNAPVVNVLAETRISTPTQVLAKPITIGIQANLQSPDTKRLLSNAIMPPETETRYLLVLDDIGFETTPTNLYELYLNLPTADYRTQGQSKYYIGLLSFFEMDMSTQHNMQHQAQNQKKSETFDITNVISTLKRDQSLDMNHLTVTIVPVGIIRKGRPTMPTNPVPLQVKRFKIVATSKKQDPQSIKAVPKTDY